MAAAGTRDEGFAWVVLASSCLSNFIDSGTVYTSALFVEEFQSSFPEARCIWLSTAQLAIATVMYTVSGALVDKFGCRIIGLTGTAMIAVGYFTSAFATDINHLYVTFSFITGVGFGLQYIPIVIIIQQYFDKKRVLATGLMSSSCSAGVFILPILERLLFDTYGWTGACLILAGLHLQTVPAMQLWRPAPISDTQQLTSVKTSENESSTDYNCNRFFRATLKAILHESRAFFKGTNVILVICCMLLTLGQYVPYIFLPLKALSLGYTPWQTASLLTIVGGAEIAGKMSIAFVGNARKVNLVLLTGCTTAAGGLSTLLIAATRPFKLLALFAASAGFFAGGTVGMLAPTLAELVDFGQLGRMYGVAFLGGALGIGVSPLLQAHGSVDLPLYLAGTSLLVSSLLITALFVYRYKYHPPKHPVISEIQVFEDEQQISPTSCNA